MPDKKAKAGRPPKKPSERKSERVSVRCTPGQKNAAQAKYGSLQAFFDWAITQLPESR